MGEKILHKELTLVWCSPHATHYNSYLFDHLFALKNCSLKVVYFAKGLAKYPWKSSTEHAYAINYLNPFLGMDWSFIKQRIKAKQELMIIAGWNNTTMLFLLLFFSMTGRRFVLYSDTPDLRSRSGLKQWLRKKVLKFVFNNTYKFLVTGIPGMKNARMIGVPERCIVNFPFATNTDFFKPLPVLKESQYVISFISSGRLDNAHKAYDLAIEAFYLLKTRHPEYLFHYRIAGTGPDQEQLHRLIREKKMNEEIKLLGWLEPADLVLFYQSGDVFLHPSHVDPFPNAVLEAMACGLPIVGSDVAGSVLDRVIEGENGYIHQDDDIESLYEKLLLICEQTAEQRKIMGAKSRETAEKWLVSYNAEVIQNIVQDYLIKA